MDYCTNNLYKEQVINESGIKGSACSKNDCTTCDNLMSCYMDAAQNEKITDVDYGGYETEIHY